MILDDPDDPLFGALCPRCGDYLGTMEYARPRPVEVAGDGAVRHVQCTPRLRLVRSAEKSPRL